MTPTFDSLTNHSANQSPVVDAGVVRKTIALRWASVCTAVTTVALVLMPVVGCAGATPQVDNPVLGAAPPRKPEAVALAQSAPPKAEKPAVVSVSFETPANGDEWAEIVGRVDGIPVFARDVLEADRPRLEQLKANAPTEVYTEQRERILMVRLPQHIEQQLLLAAVRAEFTGDQLKTIEEQLDGLFADELERLKGLAKVNTVADLEIVLDKQGTTLAQIRKVFMDRELSRQYLGLKLSKIDQPQRADVAAEYKRRADDYRLPADVKWQQLWISYAGHGGRAGAFETLQKAVKDIKSGVPFDVVIGRYSDGPMKSDGGVWDYTTRGNLANKDVEDALFTLPIGEVSRPYDVDNAFVVVRVADRREERLTPLADVETDIMRELAQKGQTEAAVSQIRTLWEAADIETKFDKRPEWQELIQRRYSTAENADAETNSQPRN